MKDYAGDGEDDEGGCQGYGETVGSQADDGCCDGAGSDEEWNRHWDGADALALLG